MPAPSLQVSDAASDAGTLLIDGAWRPIAVRAQRVSGGDLDIESRRPEAGSSVEHEISGWQVRDVDLSLAIYNPDPYDDESAEQAWGHLAALREAQFRQQSQLPVVWSLSGPLANSLDLRHVIITGLNDIEANDDGDVITCRLKLRETDPTVGVVQAQAAVTPADPAAADAPAEPAITPAERQALADAWGDEY